MPTRRDPLTKSERRELQHAANYLSRRQLSALAWAVEEAAGWRGALTDPEARAVFDAGIATARDAVRTVREMNRFMARIAKAEGR